MYALYEILARFDGLVVRVVICCESSLRTTQLSQFQKILFLGSILQE